jgi:hypothetical protein
LLRGALDRFHFKSPKSIGELKAKVYHAEVEEGRKRVLLIAASILAARKLAMYEGGTRVPATVSAIADGIRWAEQIMDDIDRRWPTAKPE